MRRTLDGQRDFAEPFVPEDVGRLWADAAHDAGELRARLEAWGMVPVIAHDPRGRGPGRRPRGLNVAVPGVRTGIGPAQLRPRPRAARPVRPLTDVTLRPRLQPPPRDHTRRCRMRIGGEVCLEDGECGRRPRKRQPNPAGSPRTPRETLPHGPMPTPARRRGNYGEVSNFLKQIWSWSRLSESVMLRLPSPLSDFPCGA